MSVEIADINIGLLARGVIPLLNPWTGALELYRASVRAQISDRELADLWIARASVSEYLRGLADG